MTTIRNNGRTIDYEKILYNIDDMIEALEYDSTRSAGKVKINAGALNELYTYRERVVSKMPKAKPAPVKKEA